MGEAEAAAKAKATTFGRERFLPGAYNLDLSSVVDIPIKVNGEASTFSEVFPSIKRREN